MEVLAQLASDLPYDGTGPGLLWPLLLFWGAAGFLSLAYSVFWIWMLIECLRSEPDKYFWIWLLIIAPFPGAIVYAVVRYFPAMNQQSPTILRKWTRGRELARLETAAEQIGNPHQFIQWGDALRDVGRWKEAGAAYHRALKKEPENLPALWGAALVAEQQKRFDDVVELTRRILDKDPLYKFGDVSLALGKALDEQGQPEAARDHFERHIKRWRHPEGLYRMACVCRDLGDSDTARQNLRMLLQDLNASPTAIARRHGRWKSRARQMLRTLPKEPAN